MPKEDKSNKAETHARVGVILELILRGFSTRQMIRYVSANEKLQWNVSARQIENYIKKANLELKEKFSGQNEQLVIEQKAKYDFIYRKTIAALDFKTAISALDKISDLAGLKTIHIDATSKGESLNNPILAALEVYEKMLLQVYDAPAEPLQLNAYDDDSEHQPN